METAALQKNISETYKKFIKDLSSFSESEINISPFEGSWTAAQLTQHLILASSGFTKMCSGKTEETDRNPAEKIDAIKDLFFNFEIKMQSPESINPPNIKYDKNLLILALQEIEQELLNVSKTFDLNLTCLAYEVSGFGKFTIYEWISFVLIHTQRHLKQLNTIFEAIKKH